MSAAAPNLQFVDLEQLRSRQMKLASSTRAKSTLKNYDYDWKKFESWCAEKGLPAFPATDDTLSLFMVDRLEGMKSKVTSVRRLAAAVVYHHHAAGLATPFGPLCRAVISATRRIRKEQPNQRAPITVDQLRQISKALAAQGTPESIRNRAIMVFGFASAMRRSSLVALQLSDLTFTDEGVIVRERSSKTDQFGKGRETGIYKGSHRDTCPVRCLKAWIKIRGKWEGPLFTNLSSHPTDTGLRFTGQAIHNVVKKCMVLIGVDPARYGGHSLRAGLVTAAVEAGASEFAIMRITGHRQVNTLKRYVRPVTVFPNRNIMATTL